MSGDVQPRKRRDKKKKKDDLEETTAHHFHARAPTPPSTNDEVIHVYKETSTGGGICAKIVFFILLSILAVLIGLIITEHRGLTDLDTIEADTRFSQIFEGWIDKTPESHDDDAHHAIESHEHDDDDDHDEHDDHDDHDEEDDHDHEEDEDEHASEEDEEHDEDEEEEEAAASEVDEEDEPSEKDDDEEEEEEEEKSAPEEDEDEEDGVTAESEQPDDDEEEDEDQKSAPDSAEPQDDDDEDENKDSVGDDDDEKDGDDDDDDEVADSKPQSVEAVSDEKDDDGDDDDDQQKSGEDNNDDDEENPETGDEDQPGEDAEGDDESNTGVVIKIGVGATILVVAYVVLVKKWKSDNSNEDANAEKKEIPVDLSRRNTIVVPPKVEEVEQVIDNDDEEYSEEEEEEIKLHPKLKQDYQQLRSTYERSLTPESDPELHGRSYDYEDEGEEDVEYDDEEAEDEENLEDEDEEVDVDEEEEPISDVDDEDLLKKLEAKYGKLETTQADDEEEPEEEEEELEEEEEEEDDDDHYQWKRSKPSGAQAQPSEDEFSRTSESPAPYEYENLTNDEDRAIKDQLDEAHEHIETNAALAVSLFNNILRQHPASPRALYGKAKSLDNLADKQRSNELLKDAIATYTNLLKISKVPPALFVAAAERCIDRMRFIGQYGRASVVHNALITRFPDEIKYRNQLAVTYLMSNRINEAREVLQKTLKRWPNDGFALVHFGFILKVNDDKLKESIYYLRNGLKSKAEGVIDGRFYFHLGDALIRLGRPKEAAEVYNEGVANKVFLSFYQRSLYNVNRLTGRPWWEKSDMSQYKNFLNMLEKNFAAIRKEGLALMNQKGYFQDEAENLRDVGEWKQFELYARGLKNADHCRKCPVTCKIVETLPDATGCRRGQIKFSVMHPGTHVWPHCGPTNCRLRVHLGLKVPKNTFIRVAKEIRSWEEGKVLIFDDSFEHEVWHNGTETRLVLIVDVWHPELTRMEKQSLSAI